jgi:hypothetical protein
MGRRWANRDEQKNTTATNPRTGVTRKARVASVRLLQLTGSLRLQTSAIAQRQGVTILSSASYADDHQSGTKNMTRRAFLPFVHSRGGWKFGRTGAAKEWADGFLLRVKNYITSGEVI